MSVARGHADGRKPRRVATGFWNPFGICRDIFGRIFAVDNDPDSRPPCRLLHVVAEGDYGYRFRNGRRGLHPFTAWDGVPQGTDLLFYEGLHGAVVDDDVDIAKYADLRVGVVPIINL